MASVETVNLKQKAVIWPFTRYSNSGDPVVSATPIEINVRDETVESARIRPDGSPYVTQKTVDVDRTIAIGSQYRLGKLEDIPEPLDKVWEVVGLDEIPDIKGKIFQRTIRLIEK